MSEDSRDDTKLIPKSKYSIRFTDQELEHALTPGTTVIGRAPTCDIALTKGATAVSRRHAEIRLSGDRIQITDLGSRNHTFVNGQDIHGQGAMSIRPGDRIEICQYEMVIVEDGKAVPPVIVVDQDSSTGTSDRSSSSPKSGSAIMLPAQHQQLSALIAFSRSLSKALNTDEVLKAAIEALMEILPAAERCVIGFIDDQGSFEPKWWQVRDSDPRHKIKVSRSVVESIIHNKDVLLIEDAFDLLPGAESVHDINLRSIMCAPLLDAEGSVFGMVQVDAPTIRRFKDHDLEVFAAVAVQIGLAINFSRAHRKSVEDQLIRRDLEQARAVQRQFLPSSAPEECNYEFADYYGPARQLGGDYFDYIDLDADRTAIVLGDVVGKGVPAALNMVRLATETRATFEITQSPAAVMRRLNRRLKGAFVTCVILVLDASRHTITLTNAGHELPLLRQRDAQVIDLGDEVTDLPLSVKEDVEYAEIVHDLAAGDTLAVFSDGFVDAEAPLQSQRFGRQRVLQVMQHHQGTPRDFADALVQEVQTYASGLPQFDDMCLVCLQRLE